MLNRLARNNRSLVTVSVLTLGADVVLYFAASAFWTVIHPGYANGLLGGLREAGQVLAVLGILGSVFIACVLWSASKANPKKKAVGLLACLIVFAITLIQAVGFGYWWLLN